MSIAALRTPADAFASLPDWPFPPQYVDDLAGYEGLRLAYVDEVRARGTPTFACTASRHGATCTGRWRRTFWRAALG